MTDEQLIAMIRAALERETRAIVPAPGLAGAIREELARPAVRERPSWWRSIGAVAWAVATLATIAGIGFAVGTLRRNPVPPQATTATTDAVPAHPAPGGRLRVGPPAGPLRANPSTFQGAAIPRTVKLVAQTPDPAGGLPWALRVFRTTRGWVCVQVGRVQSATIGVIGQDGAWNNDGRFHPISPNAYTADSCNPTALGDTAFINVAANSAIASADVPWGTGRQSGECRIGTAPARFPRCPPADLRNLNYGLLGPSAASITYVSGGHAYTEPTNGRDGAYLIVARSSTPACTIYGRGRGCVSAGGRSASAAVQAGVITAITCPGRPYLLPPCPHRGRRPGGQLPALHRNRDRAHDADSDADRHRYLDRHRHRAKPRGPPARQRPHGHSERRNHDQQRTTTTHRSTRQRPHDHHPSIQRPHHALTDHPGTPGLESRAATSTTAAAQALSYVQSVGSFVQRCSLCRGGRRTGQSFR